ncbi:uncharacterized protein LOC120543615 [Tachysurus ichikawai]
MSSGRNNVKFLTGFARHELSARNADNLLTSTRQLFRRQVKKIRGRSGGRREEPIWHANLFLLTGPDSEILPPTSALAELTKHGLGKPVHDSAEAGHTKSKIDIRWRRKIQKCQVNSVKELKTAVGKSRLYIVPQATVLQITSPPSAISQNSFPPLCTAAVEENVVSDLPAVSKVWLDLALWFLCEKAVAISHLMVAALS